MRRHNRRPAYLTALLAAAALLASACGGAGSEEAGGPITLSIATFTEFGYEELLEEYDREHPNIKIVHNTTGQAKPHHQNLITKLAAGNGLSDIEAVEEGYLATILDRAPGFHNLTKIGPASVSPDRWLDWKYQAAVTKTGKLIGYGTDIGPLAMCYRKDMFAAAGLPTEPAKVAELFTTWESFFAAGDEFIANSDAAWFDSASQIFNPMINQLEVGYFNTDNELTVKQNKGIKRAWEMVTTAVQRGQSAGLPAFSNEWSSGFKQSAFATKTCPSWMLGVIEEQAGPEHKGEWAVVEAFPGGGGNWGGSYLTVPMQSEHPEEAAKLAAWLTAPEQQLRAFQAAGTFPSQVEALQSEELRSITNEYFGGAKVGEIFAEQAKKVDEPQYKGPGDGKIQSGVAASALASVEQGTPPREAWQAFVSGAQRIAR